MKASIVKSMKHQAEKGVDLALQLGASAAKVRIDRSEGIACSIESGRLKKATSKERIGFSVTVMREGKLSTTRGNDPDALEQMVRQAVELSYAGASAHFSAYPGPSRFKKVKLFSERTLQLDREQMIQSMQMIVDKLKEYDAELDIHASAGRGESESLLVTSGGVCHASKTTNWTLGCHVQRTRDTDILFAGYGRSFADLNEFYDPNAILERILWQLREAETTCEPPTGRTSIYLPPDTLPIFIWPLAMGLNGRNVVKGESPLRGRMDQQVLDESFTLVDDPHIDWRGVEMDSDGVPTRRLTLFEHGVLKQFLYDLDTAGIAGVEPTGNNGCSPNYMLVTPGKARSDDLLESVQDGIYVIHLLGFGQSNILNGDFSANVGLGYRIKKGRLAGRIKNTMIAGNIYDILSRNVRFSADVDPVTLMPHAVFSGVTASAQTG